MNAVVPSGEMSTSRIQPLRPRAQPWSYTSVRHEVTTAGCCEMSIWATSGRSWPAICVKLPITMSRVWSGEMAMARVPPSELSLVGPDSGIVKSGSIAPVTGFSPARNWLCWPAMFWKLPPTYSAVPSDLTAMSLT